VGPNGNASEEVGLDMGSNVSRLKLADAARLDLARRDVTGGNEVADPLRGVRVDLVVDGQTRPLAR